MKRMKVDEIWKEYSRASLEISTILYAKLGHGDTDVGIIVHLYTPHIHWRYSIPSMFTIY